MLEISRNGGSLISVSRVISRNSSEIRDRIQGFLDCSNLVRDLASCFLVLSMRRVRNDLVLDLVLDFDFLVSGSSRDFRFIGVGFLATLVSSCRSCSSTFLWGRFS